MDLNGFASEFEKVPVRFFCEGYEPRPRLKACFQNRGFGDSSSSNVRRT